MVAQREKQIWELLIPIPLGYERPWGESGRYIRYAPLEMVEPEAEIVRFICDAFPAGRTTFDTAAVLSDI